MEEQNYIMQFSEEWEIEIMKVPKETIVTMFSQVGKQQQSEINMLKRVIELQLKALTVSATLIDAEHGSELLKQIEVIIEKSRL